MVLVSRLPLLERLGGEVEPVKEKLGKNCGILAFVGPRFAVNKLQRTPSLPLQVINAGNNMIDKANDAHDLAKKKGLLDAFDLQKLCSRQLIGRRMDAINKTHS